MTLTGCKHHTTLLHVCSGHLQGNDNTYVPVTSKDWESMPAVLEVMKVESPAGLSIALQLYRPASDVFRGLSCKVEVNMFELSMKDVLLSRPDSTPGPDHVTSAVTKVSTASAAAILHVNSWDVPAVPLISAVMITLGLETVGNYRMS